MRGVTYGRTGRSSFLALEIVSGWFSKYRFTYCAELRFSAGRRRAGSVSFCGFTFYTNCVASLASVLGHTLSVAGRVHNDFTLIPFMIKRGFIVAYIGIFTAITSISGKALFSTSWVYHLFNITMPKLVNQFIRVLKVAVLAGVSGETYCRASRSRYCTFDGVSGWFSKYHATGRADLRFSAGRRRAGSMSSRRFTFGIVCIASGTAIFLPLQVEFTTAFPLSQLWPSEST